MKLTAKVLGEVGIKDKTVKRAKKDFGVIVHKYYKSTLDKSDEHIPNPNDVIREHMYITISGSPSAIRKAMT